VLLVLAAATTYEALVAFEVVELGELPGEQAPGAWTVGFIAGLGLVAAALVAGWLAVVGDRAPQLAALLAPAAAAFMVAHQYTFDSYYLPTLVRYSERDVPPALVFALAGIAVATGVVTLRRRRTGLAVSVPVILACALTAWFSGLGH
jgi:hypothetical protein